MARAKYKLPDGTVVPGVTTVLNVLAKPALYRWANKMGLEGIDTSKYVHELAKIGTLIHYLVECHLAGVDICLGDYTPNEVEQAQVGFDKFLEYAGQHELDPILLEAPLVSEKGFGGTVDFFGLVDGDFTVMDFKTGKAIYSDHKTQAVAYAMLVEEAGHPVDHVRILRIGRSPDEGFEVREVDKWAEHRALFEHCLEIYRLNKELK
jgi:hypothetical protein